MGSSSNDQKELIKNVFIFILKIILITKFTYKKTVMQLILAQYQIHA